MELDVYLQSRQLSQKEFAKMLGISSCAINNYVRKKRRPTLKIALAIQKATNGKVTVQDLNK